MARRRRLAAAVTGSDDFAALSGRAFGDHARPTTLREWLTARRTTRRMKAHELTFILRNLTTLISNGVPLPKALATLAQEDTLARHRDVIDAIRRKVETGTPFSTAMADYPGVCDRITAAQIRIGERAGTLAETLEHLAHNRDKSRELRRQIIKKLAYPAMLVILGSGLITFLLLYVVPVFKQTYDEAHVALPWVTRALIAVGAYAKSYLWLVALAAALATLAIKQIRRNDGVASRMDLAILRAPGVGKWARDIAVLQLMDTLNNLMSAGFTLAEALRQTADSVGNRAVRSGVRELERAVERGERFSRELERHDELFPPIVNQLVIVGESTGQLTKATFDICEHLRREIERKTNLMVGALEPILTISLAGAIAIVLLAIYLPMFDMVNAIAQ